MRVDLVPPSAVMHIWPEAAKQLKRAAKYDASFDLDDVLLKLVSNEYQLWKAEKGFFVTGIRRRKGSMQRTFRIYYATGSVPGVASNLKRYTLQMMRFFEECARTGRFGPSIGKKCAEIRFEGRKGWARALPDYGKLRLENGNYEYFRRL